MPRKETYGLTEKIIGNWFAERKKRDKIILASKIASKSEGLEWIREGKANLGFDKKNRTVKLSIKAKEETEEREALESYKADESESIAKTSLGDLLKSKFTKKDKNE